MSGLILTSFSWSRAALVGWSTVYTYVLLLVDTLLLIAFLRVEIKFSKDPLVPLPRISERCRTCSWSHWRGMGQFRHLGPLPPVAIQWVFYTCSLCAELTCRYLRTPGRCRHGLLTVPRSSALCLTALDAVFLDRADPHRHGSSRPDLLGPDFRLGYYHALGHGHELSQRHDSSQQ